jgi:hypothetical protein
MTFWSIVYASWSHGEIITLRVAAELYTEANR